jgi:hypothetical protein
VPPDKAVEMTTHKDLKDLVRARMARTGESYTTAHRHVTARAGQAGQHHESTLLARMLERAGHRDPRTGRPYTETTLCGLAGGIGFLYAVFEYRGLPPMVTLVAQHHPQPWAEAALTRLGIGHAVRHSTSPTRALAALELAVQDAGGYCLVDRSALPWTEAPALHTDPYPVLVAGRRGGDLLIWDRAAQPYPLAPAAFAAAWSGYRKGRHHLLTVDGPGARADLAAAMRDAIATTVAHLTGPVLGNSFDVNMGFSGMRRFAEQLRDTRGRTGWAKRMAGPGALDAALRRVHECLQEQYTAPDGTRPLYADFLDEAAGVLAAPALTEAAGLFRESAEHWAAVSGGGDLGAMAADVDAARAAEEKAADIMARVVDYPAAAPTTR